MNRKATRCVIAIVLALMAGVSGSAQSSPPSKSSIDVHVTLSIYPPEELRNALKDYDEGHYSAALPELRKWAEKGDGLAALCLGMMYQYGQGGLPEDEAQMVSWYRKA